MDKDYLRPYNPYIDRPKPRKDAKPNREQQQARKIRRKVEDILEQRRIEREHSL